MRNLPLPIFVLSLAASLLANPLHSQRLAVAGIALFMVGGVVVAIIVILADRHEVL